MVNKKSLDCILLNFRSVPDREMLEKVSEQLSRAHPSLRVSIDYQSKAVPHFVMISDDCRRSVVHYMSNRNDDRTCINLIASHNIHLHSSRFLGRGV